MTDVTPPPAPPTTPLWEDLLDIFTSPTAVFERRKEDPTFWLAFGVITVVIAGVIFVARDLMAPIFDAEMSRGMAMAAKQNPNMTPEQMEAGRKIGATFAQYALMVAIPITMFCVGVVTWLVGKILGGASTFAQALMVGVYAYIPRLLDTFLGVGQAAFLSPESLDGKYRLQVGPARFLDPDTANLAVLTLLGRLDLFTIWSTVIIAIGLKVTGKLTTQKAALAGFLVWLVASLWPMWGAIRAM